ncbi:hypothetical protein [Roseibacillus ishigakijimensis]|uniref:Uncharacterized protein n=1 Tax=Roseibacillus ishigakijimensis TaxID=454146 RepID=A0A934RVF9_9BACT|nr:hypothetical protein [Roseibacillus ishigakijimensis]MBK1835734.1 hypothetical protein [Roseibacillus ishigakijimensis]
MKIIHHALVIAIVFLCAHVQSEELKKIRNFHVIEIEKADYTFAMTHLHADSPILTLSQPVKDLNHAIDLVGREINFVPLKRAGRFGQWIFFPRLTHAEDDGTFTSGLAVKVGSRVVQKWGVNE